MLFNSRKEKEIGLVFLFVILFNIAVIFLMKYMNSYIIISLLKLLLISYNIYYFYYIGLWITLKYEINEKEILIIGFNGLKKIRISIDEIEGYTKAKGNIKGVKLSGIATHNFALGRSVIKKIGTTRMFVTNNNQVIYLKTKEINYAISPENIEDFEKNIEGKNIHLIEWEGKFNKIHKIYKEWRFKVPIILTGIVIVILILNPLILYLMERLPDIMPITFDAKFNVVKVGTSKEFASAQMTYGVLNMALFFCMYYAAYFYAKYDKKVAYRYLYVPLVIALLFLFIQIKILIG